MTTQYAKYDIYFKGSVTGLSKGAPVDYSGVPVGKVAEIRLTSEQQIEVTVEIEAGVAIKKNDRASVETNILSGVSYIQISGGTKEAPLLVAEPGERYPVIRAPVLGPGQRHLSRAAAHRKGRRNPGSYECIARREEPPSRQPRSLENVRAITAEVGRAAKRTSPS